MNSYTELRNRQQEEFNAFPLGAAFSNAPFDELMRMWGLEPTDTDKIYRLPGGVFLRKSDSPAFDEMVERQSREREQAMAADKTGLGYIKDMFAAELANNEFGYTYELDETLDALGLTLDKVKADKRLRKGLNKALKKYYDFKYEI